MLCTWWRGCGGRGAWWSRSRWVVLSLTCYPPEWERNAGLPPCGRSSCDPERRCLQMHQDTCVHVCISVHVRVRAHACTHTCTRTCAHTHTRRGTNRVSPVCATEPSPRWAAQFSIHSLNHWVGRRDWADPQTHMSPPPGWTPCAVHTPTLGAAEDRDGLDSEALVSQG